MRISELSRRSGVPLPTVKYYLREGLMTPGRATGATQAEYDERHLARLRLIRALIGLAGLSLAAVREVLSAVDVTGEPSVQDFRDAVGRTHDALSPTTDVDPVRATALMARLGWRITPGTAALRQLEVALDVVDGVGLPAGEARLDAYAAAALEVAEVDLAGLGEAAPEDVLLTVVAGTVLYEPILLALRRLAQQHVFATDHS